MRIETRVDPRNLKMKLSEKVSVIIYGTLSLEAGWEDPERPGRSVWSFRLTFSFGCIASLVEWWRSAEESKM